MGRQSQYIASTTAAPKKSWMAVLTTISPRYLECAVAAGAPYQITGDEHLLALGAYDGIQILPPAGFVAAQRLWRDAGRRV